MGKNTLKDSNEVYLSKILNSVKSTYKMLYENGGFEAFLPEKPTKIDKEIQIIQGDCFQAVYSENRIDYPNFEEPTTPQQLSGLFNVMAHEFTHLITPRDNATYIGHVAHRLRHITSSLMGILALVSTQQSSIPAAVMAGVGGALFGRVLTYQLTRPNRENEKKTDIAATIVTGTTFGDLITNKFQEKEKAESVYIKNKQRVKEFLVTQVDTFENTTGIDTTPAKIFILNMLHPLRKHRIEYTKEVLQHSPFKNNPLTLG
jgi:hypothetical protein